MTEAIVRIHPKRSKPIRNQHPWIFSGAIAKSKETTPGAIVKVVDHAGNFLARGYWNQRSQIQVRILSWQDEPIDDVWWQTKLSTAIQNRLSFQQQSDAPAYRAINAESDYLPGLIVDRYGNFLVFQALTLHIDQKKHDLAIWLADIYAELGSPIQGVFERSDVDVRGKEGLQPNIGVLWGKEPPNPITVRDHDVQYAVDVHKGHKTGHYLDQAHNYVLLRQVLAQLPDTTQINLLNMFSYTGVFGCHALKHPVVQVTNVDTSHDALAQAEHNVVLNDYDSNRSQQIQADAFDYLRYCVAEKAKL